MQEEVTKQGVVLVYNGAKLTARVLKKLLGASLKAIKTKAAAPKRGKQSYKSLMKKDQGADSLEISKKQFKEFSRVAKKYGVDFAFKKVKGVKGKETKHLLFFKARDNAVITAAFAEYSRKSVTKNKRPSVLKKLRKFKEISKAMDISKEKIRTQEISR